MAREQRREKSRKLDLAFSERILYDFSRDQAPDNFPQRYWTYFTCYEAAINSLILLYRSLPSENNEVLKQSILAARTHKGWRDFAMCGYKFSQEPSLSEKRTNRYLLIGQALDAFEEIPKETKGVQFMKNDWCMGPFYAWDKNFLKHMPSSYDIKWSEREYPPFRNVSWII